MFTLSPRITRMTALALLLGSTALVAPAHATIVDPTAPAGPPSTFVDVTKPDQPAVETPNDNQPPIGNPQAPGQVSPHHHMAPAQADAGPVDGEKMHHHGPMSPEKMKEVVEERISTLHEKLMITPGEESAWGNVAQAMRDSEASTVSLIEQRKANASKMTAPEDLQSYQDIAQSHADGLKKVIAAFQPLYDEMPASQKANADKVFDSHEHGGKHQGKKLHHHKAQ